MAWRKWMVRTVVYGIMGACVLAALLYQRWTNPSAVREQIIAKLSEVFPGAEVSVDSARLRLLGGIQLNGLRLMRANDPEKHEFLHVPSAIFYHDKEKILEGELTLRKIELQHPRLRVRREKDGVWNLQGVMRKPASNQIHFPAVVIHQGTVIFEDRQDPLKSSSLEVNDISLTIINDPLSTVTIRGAANSELLGKLQLQGQFHRVHNEATLSFSASQIPLTQALVARFPSQCPSHILAGLQLQALAGMKGQLSYHHGQTQPWFYEVHCEVQGGTVQHPQLPLPLENLQAKIHCNNGELHLEKLTARSGATEIEAEGMGHLPALEREFEAQLDLRHVMLGNDLADRLPDKIRNLHNLFQLNGPTTIHIACARHEGQWVSLSSGDPSQVSLLPEGISLAFKGFAYPLEHAVGKVDYNILNKMVKVDMKAYAGDRPILLHGHWTGEGPQSDVQFDIHGTDLPIDDKLLQALPTREPNLQKFAESFHARGKIDVKSFIRKEPGQGFRNEYHVYFHDATIRWDNFPYPLKNVSGILDIYPDHWEFHEFQGIHNQGHVLVHGQSTVPKNDEKGEKPHGISLEITGRDIVLGDELRDALRTMPGMHKAWETFNPQGRLYFTASVNRPTSDLHDLDVHLDARGCSVRPTFFPYRVQEMSGQFRFHHHRLEINQLRARHDKAIIALDRGTVDLYQRGGDGYYADLLELQIQGLQLDEEFLRAMPGKLQTAARALHLQEPLRLKTRLVVAQPPETGKPPDVYWDSQLWMYDAKFTSGLEVSKATGTLACTGRYNGREIVGVHGNFLLDQATLYEQPFKNMHASFQVRDNTPDTLLVGLRAPVFGGDVTGQLVVNFKSVLDYKLNLTASQINVAEFGRHNLGPKSQLSGTASARIYLAGLGTDPETLEGNGAIDIPRGHFYNLPFLLDLLKFLGLHWPDRTAFEEFHTTFGIQGRKVNLQRCDLLGSAVSLSGKGEYDLQSHKLDLDIYPMWGRIEQLLPPMVRPFPTTVSKNLLTVEVRGKMGGNTKDLKYTMKPIPILFDPLLLLRDRMLGQDNTSSSESSPASPGLSVPVQDPQRQRRFRIWD